MKVVAVVTGIARTSGIGHAICTTLLENGLAVVGFDKNPLDSSSTLPTQYPNHFRTRVCPVDGGSDAGKSLRQNLLTALEELGESHVGVVVNNAGLASPYMPAEEENGKEAGRDEEEKELHRLETRLHQYDNYIRNNLRSAFLVTEVCKPFFLPPRVGGGDSSQNSLQPAVSIINISSTRAIQSEMGGSYAHEGYASAKAGMIGLTHALGQSLAGRARVNVILPGWINTEDGDGYIPADQDHAWHTTGRVGKPNDVAEMVAFLADNERSGFISCQEFVVDGGVSKRMYYPE